MVSKTQPINYNGVPFVSMFSQIKNDLAVIRVMIIKLLFKGLYFYIPPNSPTLVKGPGQFKNFKLKYTLELLRRLMYSSIPLATVSLSVKILNIKWKIKWKIPEINNSYVLNCMLF